MNRGARTRRPHVVVVTCNPVAHGGMQTFTRTLVRALLDGSWRVTLALSGRNLYDDLDPEGGAHLRIEPVDWIDEELKGDREYRLGRIADRWRWFRRVRADVALFVQSSNTPYRASIAGAWLAGVPVVTTHRTLPWPVERVPSRRHLFGLVPGIGLHRRRMVLRTWLTARLARCVVYNSHAVRAAYEALYCYPRRKGRVIPNAVAPAGGVMMEPTRRRDDATVIIGYLGRLGREKRVDLLIDAAAQIHTARRWRVQIYGDGPERGALASLVTERRLSDRVQFCGATDEPGTACATMDIVVVCSDREASSNAALEAMASGKTVVLTRVGGLPELVGEGACGQLVGPGDAGALASALTQLIEDDYERLRLGKAARDAVADRHAPDKVARLWCTLLAEAAGIGTRQNDTMKREPLSRESFLRAPMPTCVARRRAPFDVPR